MLLKCGLSKMVYIILDRYFFAYYMNNFHEIENLQIFDTFE